MPPIARVSVTFRLFGDSLDPKAVSAQLGVEPSYAHAKGDLVPSRQARIHRRSVGTWQLASAAGDGATLEAHLSDLLDRLPADGVRSVTAVGYQADFFCGLFLDVSNEGLILTPETLGRIASLGATLGLDIYSAPGNEPS
jgi:hypothetical protein